MSELNNANITETKVAPHMQPTDEVDTTAHRNASVNTEEMNSRMIGRDTGMDISSLLKASTEPVNTEKELTPLEKAKQVRENGGGLGLVVENEELAKANEKKSLVTNKSENDAMKEVDAYTEEMDRMIQVAQNSSIAKKPTSPEEMVSLIDQLDSAAKGETIKVGNGEKVMLNTDVVKTETVDEESAVIDETIENEEEKEEPIDPVKQNIVNILIDKTGLGGNFDFTEEEKEKLFSASEIVIKEVEEVSLQSIKVKKAERSFIDTVNEFQMSSSKVPVVFPASRFRAYMTGLSYGEMGDIALNTENITFDQIHKKLSVIYNKMINPSCGKFESFEDFLRKFAYVDIDLAIYGLVVATFPEVDDIPLTCNHPQCKKSFNHKFSPRTLIRFENSDMKFISAMNDVIDCKESDFDDLVKESPTRTYKRYKLPESGFIVDIGIASSYDYLYDIVENMMGDKFAEMHPDDVNGILQLNTALLGFVRGVYVPNSDGEYVQYTKFEDMIQALYYIKPYDIAVLSSILSKYGESYQVSFELKDVICPHCGTKTKSIPLDINYLVFLKYQRLMSTELNIDNISVL